MRAETAVPGIKMLHVMDCVGKGEAMQAAACFIEQYAKDHGFDAVDFYCTAAYSAQFFLARGWFSTMDDDCLNMPHLFHPVELRIPATTSLVYWAKHDAIKMCDLSKLYITKQDADLDRPTYNTLVQ